MFFQNYARWDSFRFKGRKFLALHRRDRNILMVGANMENYGAWWSLAQFKKAWVAGRCEDLRTPEEKDRGPVPAIPKATEGAAQVIWHDDDGRTLWFAKDAHETVRGHCPLGKRGYWYCTDTLEAPIYIGASKKDVRELLPHVNINQ